MFGASSILIFFVPYALSIGTADVPNEEDANALLPKTYFFSKNALSVKDATEACEGMDMELVSIQTDKDHETLQAILQDQGLNSLYWTSGHRASAKDPWVWLHDERITKFYWNKREPNNAKKNEFCIEMRVQNGKMGWNDERCSAKRNYICQVVPSGCAGNIETADATCKLELTLPNGSLITHFN